MNLRSSAPGRARRFGFHSVWSSYAEAFRGLPRDVWLLSAVLLVNRCGTMVLPFWTLYCKTERGFTATQVGSLLALYGVGGFFGAMLGGWLTDRIGPFKVQWMSLLSTGIGFLVLVQVETLGQIALALFVLSVVAETIRPASSTATANVCPKELHPRAMALNRLAVNLGMSIGPALGGFLATRSFHLLFWCDGLTCIAAGLAFLGLFGVRDRKRPANRPHANLLRPWFDRHFACFGFCNFLLAIVFFQFLGTYVLYFQECYGLREFEIGLLMSINTVIIVIFEMILVRRVEHRNTLRVVAVGFFFSGVGFCILPFGTGLNWAILSILIWTFGEMLSMPLGAAFAAGRADEADRGSYMGAYSMTYAAAFVVAPVVGMWAYSIDPNLVWYGGFVITFVSVAGTWWLSHQVDRETRRVATATQAGLVASPEAGDSAIAR